MDFFLHYTNPNYFHSPSLLIPNNTNNTTSFHAKDQEEKKTRNNKKMRSASRVKLSADPQSVAARQRRHRISERFKILRSLIPSCDTKNMDTVSMLEEAIQYVKYLQSQILLHQTMISFENFYDHNQDNNLPHYAFDHDFYGDEIMMPQLGFEEEPNLVKVEGVSTHHHAMYS